MIPVDPALVDSRPTPAAAADGAPVAARALIEGQLVMLSRLAQIGMEIAEAVGREAQVEAPDRDHGAGPGAAPDAAEPPGHRRDLGLVFARVARAVRMTIALQSRLAADLAALDRADDLAERAQRDMRRMRLRRLVDQAAEAAVDARREAGGRYWADEDAVEDEIERLSSEAYERLTDAEEGDLWGRSFDEVVAGICADLGLSPAWQARLSAATAAPPGHGGGDAPRAAGVRPAAAEPPDPRPPGPPVAALVPPAAWPGAPAPDP
jgi:hypothetical protein